MKRLISINLLLLLCIGLFAQEAETKKDINGNEYVSYSNDPSNSRWYTLENGLTVILSENKTKPRVQTLIATKAGSSSDPSDNTGLAHYLEHLLFKGTDKYGSLNYEKESVILAEVDALYERYNKTTDPIKRKEIYHLIDSVSGEAAKFAIANEYDRMLQGIGAQATNAFTSFERTVYVNDVPSNQINTWLDIEAERFRKPVLRLFHTELEAVYEEKNIGMDNDNRQVYEKLFAEIFPNHNYGMQTTIGTIEHLKNPSIQKIREYFNTYYVPNNMAVIIAGDINQDETFELIKAKFGYMSRKEVPTKTFIDEVPLGSKRTITVSGPSAESITMGYRVPDALDEDANLVRLVDLILANSKAGLIDLNMVKSQKCVQAYCSPMLLKERGLHYFGGVPLEGQSLEDLEQLFYEQLEKLKSGDFDMNLIKSIVLNEKVSEIRQFESNAGAAYSLLESFIIGTNWGDDLNSLEKMLSYSKEDIMNFAKQYYVDGHVVLYKIKGEKEALAKIEKPEITKVEVNRGMTSPFVDDILTRQSDAISPKFVDYNKDIEFGTFGKNTPIWKVKDADNQLFNLYYVLDIGSYHDQKLALAVEYLEYLGTTNYSADQVSKAFYDLACNFGVSTGREQSYVYLSGLESSFEEALKLFEHLLADAQPDQAKLNLLIDQKLKERTDAKLNKSSIMSKMRNYVLYGQENPSNYVLSANDLRNIKAEELTDYIHNLSSYKHKVWYNGPLSLKTLSKCLNNYHPKVKKFIETPPLKEFEMKDAEDVTVYFTNYDMVQAEIMWLKKSNILNVNENADISMFNEYFGGGMSSVVFQDIRESKALAYSTYSYYAKGSKLGENNMVMAYVGTQSDKLGDAIVAMNDLLTNLPVDQGKFENGKNALKQNIETSRILKTSILFDYDNSLKLGLTQDPRIEFSKKLETITMEDVVKFHSSKIKGDYQFAVLGSEDSIDFELLKKYGIIEVLTLEQLFGY